jgi:ubiquinone/menaquinone biosynthesis C-methylase UbiE
MTNLKEEQEKVWNSIAESWHSFRQKPLRIAEIKALEWKRGRILEVGCGNCRNLKPFAEHGFDCYGIDFSKKMLESARMYSKKHNLKIKLKKAYATSLPFPSRFFDYILCLATFHHLSKDEREKTLEEMRRVLKPKGKVIISVWNKLQMRFIFKRKDLMIPWRTKGKEYKRYYHLFTSWELKSLLKKHRFKVLKHNIFGKNLVFFITPNNSTFLDKIKQA